MSGVGVVRLLIRDDPLFNDDSKYSVKPIQPVLKQMMIPEIVIDSPVLVMKSVLNSSNDIEASDYWSIDIIDYY